MSPTAKKRTPKKAVSAETEADVVESAFPAEAGTLPEETEAKPTESVKYTPVRREERLQKIIAAAGVTSRRKAEELITEGRVQVNGQTVVELGAKADAALDHIRVDGKLLAKPGQGTNRLRYAVLNKPKGYITSASDPEGRPTVMKFFPGQPRVFPVGRLDYQSEGLLLMTNDGDLAHLLTRAANKVQKVYLVKISGKPSDEALNQLRAGIMIDKGRTQGRKARPGAHPASRNPPRPRRRKPLVRSHPHRRPQPRNPQDVRGGRPLRRKDPPRRIRPAGARCRARRGARTEPRRSAAIATCSARHSYPVERGGSPHLHSAHPP
jgi:16S rRNA U516 pseudouridylate synthase RsuA-like enzyme